MATSYAPDSRQQSSLTSLPAEVRVKIYQALFDDIKITYTLTDEQLNNVLDGVYFAPEDIPRACQPSYPFAILSVNQQIRQEAQPIESTRQIHLELRWWGKSLKRDPLHGPSPLISLPTNMHHRVRSISSDDYWADHWTIKCCLDESFLFKFPNLRTFEVTRRGPPIRKYWQNVRDLINADAREHRWPEAERARIVRAWPVPGTGTGLNFDWNNWHTAESDRVIPLREHEEKAVALDNAVTSRRLRITMPVILFGWMGESEERERKPTDFMMRAVRSAVDIRKITTTNVFC